MFAQLSRSRHTELKINGPSLGRGSWFETESRPRHNHLCKVLQALGTVVAILQLLLLSNSSFHASSGHFQSHCFQLFFFRHSNQSRFKKTLNLNLLTDQKAAAVCLRLRVCYYTNTNVNSPELLAPFFNAGRD